MLCFCKLIKYCFNYPIFEMCDVWINSIFAWPSKPTTMWYDACWVPFSRCYNMKEKNNWFILLIKVDKSEVIAIYFTYINSFRLGCELAFFYIYSWYLRFLVIYICLKGSLWPRHIFFRANRQEKCYLGLWI